MGVHCMQHCATPPIWNFTLRTFLHGRDRPNSRTQFFSFSRERNTAMDEIERHEAGMRVRRSVLGDAHVDRAEASKDSFDEEFQNFISRYAWGEIWSRPGLPRH